MESFIADLINSPKVPRPLRYGIVTIVCGIVIFLGVMLVLKSPITAGKIFGGALSALFLVAAICLYIKIAKSKNKKRNPIPHVAESE